MKRGNTPKWLLISRADAARVGDVAMHSAGLEFSVDWALRSLTGMDEYEYKEIVGSKLMLNRKLELAKALGQVKLRSKSQRKTFVSLIDTLHALVVKRNTVIHGLWQPDGAWHWDFFEPGNTRKKPMDFAWVHARGNKQPLKVTESELAKLPNLIQKAHGEFGDFWVNAWVMPRLRRSKRFGKGLRKSSKESRARK